jgi:parallel beta-helix repeat protein
MTAVFQVPSANAAPPCAGVTVSAGQSLQAAIDANPAGTTFCIKPGTYYLARPLSPKNNQKFIGKPSAVLSGGKDITGQFVQSGSYWVASNQTQRNPNSGSTSVCYPPGETVCQYPEDVYRDKRPLKRVLSLSDLRPGAFYFDYGASKIYLADNPSGHTIEAAVGTRAFVSGATGVAIRNLVIELFANETGAGAIWANYDWDIENNEVFDNHGIGILAGGIVRNNYVHDNGQCGIATFAATQMLVENNEIAYNDYAGYDSHYDGGGTKFMESLNVTVRGNNVHDNYGVGLWFDWDNKGILVENNTITNNDGPGIFHEAGYDAVFRNNVVRGNGFNFHSGWIDGAGIELLASGNTEIYGNTVEKNLHGIGLTQTDRGSGAYGPHETHDVYVHDNVVSTVSGGVAAGFVQSGADSTYYTTRNIRFEHNSYTTCPPAYWAWARGADGQPYISAGQWVADGNDTTGTFNTGC